MWKNIKDCCPIEGQRILAYTLNNDIVLGYWVSYENGVCDTPDGVSSWKWGFTHWMPAPSPPTADNVEGANLQHTTQAVRQLEEPDSARA